MSQHELRFENLKEAKLDIPEDQAVKLAALRVELEKLGEPFSRLTDACVFRFLRWASFDEATAVTNITEWINWRKDKNESFQDPTPEKTELIRHLVPYAYHGFDKEGRPVYYEKTGKMQAWAVSQLVSEQEFINSHIVGMEKIGNMCYESAQKRGETVDTITAVLDMDGLGMGHRSAIFLLKACADFDGKYYPNKTGRILILNAPWCVNFLWPLVQGLLDEVTKSRIDVVTGDIASKLSQFIDMDQIPKEYGGACTCCEGNECIKQLDCSEILAKLENKSDDGMEKMNVGAGAKVTKQLTCGDEGGVFTWAFESEGGYDIDFSVEVEEAGQDKFLAKQVSRCITNKGEYTAKKAATVTFVFDNTFSWMTSKDVKFLIGTIPIPHVHTI